MTTTDWQPTASVQALRARAALLENIRAFFRRRGVLEVDTPLLSHASGSDPNLDPLAAQYRPGQSGEVQALYLQTSPEFAMKRLLASGSGPIFQICKAFRNGESGRRHNPEFTLLEWYRPGFDHEQLMDEVAALLAEVAGVPHCRRRSYAGLFEDFLGLDPHSASLAHLRARAREHLDVVLDSDERDTWLDLLYSHLIEPQLSGAVFIQEYPASQAALARLGKDAAGRTVAQRFELVLDGLEIANGYFELTDPVEQRERFERDLRIRRARGQTSYPLDERLLAALHAGLPPCAGVALGVDRLLMRMLQQDSISGVLAFPLPRA